ncbi:MAG TPA: selenocysteine-specific translation elongation factor [Spirochaeta sp.]|nr:selenocysteine-specific translation elongation factor [Spirochaeta sp.]
MNIIGTAGHVDHGKTLLIKALSGIDTDRLPEEKKRGLTIDLGFAHFRNDEGDEIGIVDVPGHERFIRNMVAGAWGIDLALLVVAADDGWMFQTGNHLTVLKAMGIESLIAVITKTDAVEPQQTEEVIEDVQLRLLEETGREHPVIGVSSLKGENIAELKRLISKTLKTINRDQDRKTNIPVLHIDRAFNIRGAGLVVTGSLREGTVQKNDSLLLLPNHSIIRVRGIQSYDAESDSVVPSCRAALNIIGADASDVKRGCCLTTTESDFTAETEVIIELIGSSEGIRNHSEAEFAAGTAHSLGSIHFLKNPSGFRPSGLAPPELPPRARVSMNEAMPLRHGQPIVIIRKGGSLITGSGRVIWKGNTAKNERISIASSLKTDRQSLELAVNGWTRDNERWHFDDKKRVEFENRIVDLASSAGGVKSEELKGLIGLPAAALKQLIIDLISSGKVTDKNNILTSGKTSESTLSKAAAQILKETELAGKAGLDIAKKKIPGANKDLRILTRAGLIVPLTETLFMTEKVYTELCSVILKGLKKGDTFDIAQAKERTGLSRKYIIPILNKMEERKIVKREENLRRVL